MLRKIKEDDLLKIREYYSDIKYKGCFDVLYCLIKYSTGLRFAQIRNATGLTKYQTHKAIKHLIDRDYLEKKERVKNGFSFNVYAPTNKAKKKQYIIIEIYKPLF